jgi:hypothetical protein
MHEYEEEESINMGNGRILSWVAQNQLAGFMLLIGQP